MMRSLGAKRLGLARSCSVATRKKVIWKPSGSFSGVSSQPVTYHHSFLKPGCAPKSRGNTRGTFRTTGDSCGRSARTRPVVKKARNKAATRKVVPVSHLNPAWRHLCLGEQVKYSTLRFTARITSPPLRRVLHYPKQHGAPMPLP